jgi:hypothetical protein
MDEYECVEETETATAATGPELHPEFLSLEGRKYAHSLNIVVLYVPNFVHLIHLISFVCHILIHFAHCFFWGLLTFRRVTGRCTAKSGSSIFLRSEG